MAKMKPIILRLFAKVDKTDSCWLFTGKVCKGGYGSIGIGKRGEGTDLVHRVVYKHFKGEILGEINHTCKVRNCVNPEHLEDVPHSKNMEYSRKTHCIRGHEFTEENTWWSPSGNRRRCRSCSKERNKK